MKTNSFLKCFLLGILASCGQVDESQEVPLIDTSPADNCTFQTSGRNRFFVLEPGYRLTLEGMEGSDTIRMIISVLAQTKVVAEVETRVLEERELVNNELKEISRNFVAFCRETEAVYYFGEEVDFYKNGRISGHEGEWLADGKNKPGILMPGKYLIGSRYYQEHAPGKAMDRGEIISLTDSLVTPAGTFHNCLRVRETSPLEPGAGEYKIHAQGIGLVRDEDLLLVSYGFED